MEQGSLVPATVGVTYLIYRCHACGTKYAVLGAILSGRFLWNLWDAKVLAESEYEGYESSPITESCEVPICPKPECVVAGGTMEPIATEAFPSEGKWVIVGAKAKSYNG